MHRTVTHCASTCNSNLNNRLLVVCATIWGIRLDAIEINQLWRPAPISHKWWLLSIALARCDPIYLFIYLLWCPTLELFRFVEHNDLWTKRSKWLMNWQIGKRTHVTRYTPHTKMNLRVYNMLFAPEQRSNDCKSNLQCGIKWRRDCRWLQFATFLVADLVSLCIFHFGGISRQRKKRLSRFLRRRRQRTVHFIGW